MEDLPLGRIAALVPEFALKDLPLGITLMMMISVGVAYQPKVILLYVIISQNISINELKFYEKSK